MGTAPSVLRFSFAWSFVAVLSVVGACAENASPYDPNAACAADGCYADDASSGKDSSGSSSKDSGGGGNRDGSTGDDDGGGGDDGGDDDGGDDDATTTSDGGTTTDGGGNWVDMTNSPSACHMRNGVACGWSPMPN